MDALLILVSAAAAVAFLVSSAIQVARGRASAGFWATFAAFVVVACAVWASFAAPTLALVRAIAVVTAAALIAVDGSLLVFERRLAAHSLKTSRAALEIAAGALVLAGVVAASVAGGALAAQTTQADPPALAGQATTQNVAFRGGAFAAQTGASAEATAEATASAGAFQPPQAPGAAFGQQAGAQPTETATPFPTATALPTHPPQPSATPTNTPFVIATMTATGTVTPAAGASADVGQSGGAVCVVYPNHNLNLRAGPSTDAERLLTIPASTALQPSARTDNSSWFQVTYQNQTGWVSAAYVDLADRCAALPVASS